MPATDELLMRARAALSDAAYRTGDFDAVEAQLAGALRQAVSGDDRPGEAAALDLLGQLQHYRTIDRPRDEWPGIDHGPERDRFERSLAIRSELGDRAGVAESLLHLGWVHQVLLGDGAAAMPLFREALDLVEPAGDTHVRSELHRHIGFHLAIDERRPEEALPHFRMSLELWRSGSEPALVIAGLVALARSESAAGRHEDALAHSQEALDLVAAGSYRPRMVNGAVEARRVVEAAAARSTVSVEASPRGDGWDCTVEVVEPRGTTRHQVAVTARDRRRWGQEDETVEQLVRRAFEFLLARESPSQILPRFGLSDVQRYFPEFDEAIRGR